jgi:hypothetical protein
VGEKGQNEFLGSGAMDFSIGEEGRVKGASVGVRK